MRSLATSDYTAEQVEAVLRGPAAAYTSRFELLDRNNTIVGDISNLVVGATRTWDGSRPIKGSLALTLLADDDLADALFFYRVKPWFGVRMPDGGVAEYAQGVYLWSLPDRKLGGVDAEEWEVTLGDLTHILDLEGPGVDPFQVARGSLLTDAIKRVLNNAGFTDTSGVVPSDSESADFLSWGMKRNVRQVGGDPEQSKYSTTPETWLSIIGDLDDGLGYNEVWFDPDGLAICAPAPDLATASAAVTYATESDGIMLTPVESEHDLSEIANRVFARSKTRQPPGRNTGGGGGTSTAAPLTVGVANANTVLPNHPLSEARIGFYVDAVVDNEVASTQADLDAQARRELQRRITGYEVVTTPSLAWPVHEGFELIGVRFDGDRDLDTERLFLEDQHSLVLRADRGTGTMSHRLRRVADVEAV